MLRNKTLVECPACKITGTPKPLFSSYGEEVEYEHSECNACGYIFKANELVEII